MSSIEYKNFSNSQSLPRTLMCQSHTHAHTRAHIASHRIDLCCERMFEATLVGGGGSSYFCPQLRSLLVLLSVFDFDGSDDDDKVGAPAEEGGGSTATLPRRRRFEAIAATRYRPDTRMRMRARVYVCV
jgi:hypothetical protein